MNITLLINAAGGGGAEKQALLNAALLQASGYRCRVFCLARVPQHDRMEQLIADIAAVGVEVVRPAEITNFSPKVVWRLLRLLASGETHVIWTWGHRAELVRIVCLFPFWRVVPVASLRSAHEGEIRRMRWLWAVSDVLNAAYISNSRLNCEILASVLPSARNRMCIVHNILEDAALREPALELPAEAPPRLELVMLGNIRNQIKGYDLAVELIARLKLHGHSVRLRIGGYPHEGHALQAMIDDAGVSDEVILSGVVFKPYDFLRSGHVFLLMSRIEGMPNALLEAMSIGLPCIATRVGDVGNFVKDREHLRVVPIGGIDEAEQVLIEWRENWMEARRLAGEARRLCHGEFSPARIRERLMVTFTGIESHWGKVGLAI